MDSGFDLSCTEMVDKLTRFQERIAKDDLVVFFFSGHGVQWKEQNYLIPIDNESLLTNPSMYGLHSISTQSTLATMMENEPFAVIFLLDCCRISGSNDQQHKGKKKAMIMNSEPMNSIAMKGVVGSLIAFACGPDAATFDTSPNKRNGLFTYHLLKHLTKPDFKVEEMMCLVCDVVYEDSDGTLFTHRTVCLRTSNVYFNAGEAHTSRRK